MPPPPMRRPHSVNSRTWLIVGGAGALVLVFLWLRNRQNSASGAIQSNSATAPTLESTGFTSGITDTSNNLPYEDTWPYNQLALPYNYTQGNSDQIDMNANYLLPNQADFVGNQQSVVSVG